MKKVNMEAYLRKTGKLPKQDFGIMYFFSSSRNGCEPIKELLIWECKAAGTGSRSIDGDLIEVDITRYSFQGSPYNVDFWKDKVVQSDSYGGSGWGDLWSYSYFFSKDKDALTLAWEQESIRITEKYLTPSELTLEINS